MVPTSAQAFCACGAWRGSLGLEPTPDLYVSHLVEIFREVRRVLRDDGTLWLNMGDSYAANRGYQVKDSKHVDVGNHMGMSVPSGLKPKDLVGMPWRVAFALQADGWWLRSDIVWHKPNPMPESITDRPTRSHEYVFLLSKSQRYYYDAEAIKEPCQSASLARYGYAFGGAKNIKLKATDKPTAVVGKREYASTRNKRDVWTINAQAYKGAHFATFPEKLVEPCILAGSPKDGVILDPFMGSGTVLVVAKRHGRSAIGIELNESYVNLAKERLAKEKRDDA